jgi:hypothetical protein
MAAMLRAWIAPLALLLICSASSAKPGKGLSYEDFVGLRPQSKESKAERAKKDEGKAFAEVIAEADTLAGLFTVYHKTRSDEAWLEIRPDQLGRDFILSRTLESGAGGRGLVAGLPAGHMVIRFDKRGETIQVVRRNLMFRSAGGLRTGDMVERSVAESPQAALKIVARPEPERGSWLVSLDDWLKKDRQGLAERVGRSLGAEYSQVEEQSWWSLLKSFPRNTEIGVMMGFRTRKPAGGRNLLEDPRSVQVLARHSLSELPEGNYRPRLADDRVGYFQTGWRLWGDDTREDPMIRVANRWHLVKQEPGAALSEPVEPIVFWLEHTVPEEYRDAIRRGTLLWNRAFEGAGFKNAVVVKQMPDDADWDPADIRYNTIRWIASNEPSFGAMGPSQVDPYTGQILNADILIEADMVRRVAWGWRAGIGPLGHEAGAGAGPAAEELPLPGDGLLAALQLSGAEQAAHWAETGSACGCQAAARMAEGASAAGRQLAAAGLLGPGEPLPWTIVEQYLVSLAAHEVGHTLGLRHNFAASRMLDFEQLWDAGLTARTGLVSSVMEYNGACVALDPARQGDYYTRTLGPYDLFAIEWGYTPTESLDAERERALLEGIAARSATDPALRYGTDEDAYDVRGWGSAVDPTIRTFDLGGDEEAWLKHSLELATAQLALPPEKILKAGDDHGLYRQALERAFGSYWGALQPLARYLGGYTFSRQPWGAGEAPLRPIEGALQRRMLEQILDGMLDEGPWSSLEERLDLLGPGLRWSFDRSGAGRIDLDLRGRLASQRARLLAELYNPGRLARMVELEARSGDLTLRLDELHSTVLERCWQAAPRRLEERDLQRAHAGLLIEVLLDEKLRGVPPDARLLARADLQQIRQRIGAWQLQKIRRERVDAQHLEDLAGRIELALARDRDKL